MKTKQLLFVIAALFISIIAFAQKTSLDKKDNLLFLLRQTEHINQALKTIDQLDATSASSSKIGKVAIIVCGEAVTALSTDEATSWVEKISKNPNISIMACGLSLDKFKKTREDLVEGIGYTENGFIKAFELQKQGYLSVEL